jgi:tetratricopeptide (TPR) repeat protein
MNTDLRQQKFLIIDDFASFRSSVVSLLQSLGIERTNIDTASNGETALQAIKNNHYDIILSDYNLGDDSKDGQQILEEAKDAGLIGLATIYIMITAENARHMVMSAIEYRPDSYFVKPLNRDACKKRLETLLIQKAELTVIDEYLESGNYNQAIAECNRKLAKNPPNMITLIKTLGTLYMKFEDYQSAAKVYEKILNTRRLPWALLELGKIHRHQGQNDTARALFEEALREDETYIQAYDQLAKIYTLEEDMDTALELLQKAVNLSPKVVIRQQNLAALSMKMDKLDIAEKAFSSCIRWGKHSKFKAASDFTGLSKIYLAKKTPRKALPILKEARRAFYGQPQQILQTALAEVSLQKRLEQPELAQKSLNEAAILYATEQDKLPIDLCLEMANAYLHMGQTDKSDEIFLNLIKNNHEDETLANQIKEMTSNHDLDNHTINQKIDDIRIELITLNNRGVKRFKQGHHQQAIEILEDVVLRYPNNPIINRNLAQAMVTTMEEHGIEPNMMKKANTCLQKAKKHAQHDKKLFVLQEKLNMLRFEL